MENLREPDLEQNQFLTFFVAGEEYGVGILQAKEILQYDTITRVPRTPEYIHGVINLRGNVIPVVDLAVKFCFDESYVTKWSCILITEVELDGEPTVFGMLVDRVSQVIDMLDTDLDAPPAFGADIQVDYILGMAQVDGELVLILDVDRVLSEKELIDIMSIRQTLLQHSPLQGTDEQGSDEQGAGGDPSASSQPVNGDDSDR